MPVNPNDFEYRFSPESLVEIRERLGLSQAKLAERLNVPVNTISRWERKDTTPDANALAAIHSIAVKGGLKPEFFQRSTNRAQNPRQRVEADCLEIIKATKGKPVKTVALGNSFKKAFGKHGVSPESMGVSKNHPTKSLLNLLKEQGKIQVSPAPGDLAAVIVKMAGAAPSGQNRSRYFTIQRKGSPTYELTVVGKDGQEHTLERIKKGKDGHFTDEGRYRRAIEQAVAQNSR